MVTWACAETSLEVQELVESFGATPSSRSLPAESVRLGLLAYQKVFWDFCISFCKADYEGQNCWRLQAAVVATISQHKLSAC